MVKLGIDPLDALRAGTRNGAELLGKLDDLGTIEPGKLADLVLCEGDVDCRHRPVVQPRQYRVSSYRQDVLSTRKVRRSTCPVRLTTR